MGVAQERYQVLLSCQIDAVLDISLALKSDDIQPLLGTELLVLYMVLQIVFQRVFSHLPGSLGHFADSNIPIEPAHHCSSNPDCNSTAEVPCFTLFTALSTVPFVSDLCGVDVQ